MRLLQICTCFVPGGIQRHVLDLSEWLRSHDHHVTLAGSPGAWARSLPGIRFAELDILGVTAEGGSLARRLATAASAALRLRKILVLNDIEVIHAHDSAPALVAWMASLGTGIPLVLTFHGAEDSRIAEFGRIARLSANIVIAQSRRSASELRAVGGVAESKIRILGLGIATKSTVPEGSWRQLRAQLLGSSGRRLVLTVARLAHQKAIDVLIDTVHRTVQVDPGLRFVVVGDGPQRDEVRRWIVEANVGEFITLAGHSDQVQTYMTAADLFLLPSRWESLPITIVEAFREGLPVIATDTGGVRDLVDDSVGAVVAVGDVDALSQRILSICGDDALRLGLSEAARARGAEQRFSPQHVHRCFEQEYAAALERGRQR